MNPCPIWLGFARDNSLRHRSRPRKATCRTLGFPCPASCKQPIQIQLNSSMDELNDLKHDTLSAHIDHNFRDLKPKSRPVTFRFPIRRPHERASGASPRAPGSSLRASGKETPRTGTKLDMRRLSRRAAGKTQLQAQNVQRNPNSLLPQNISPGITANRTTWTDRKLVVCHMNMQN